MTTDHNKYIAPQQVGTYVDLLRHRAQAQPEQRAYTFLNDGEADAVHLTYAELDRQARSIAALLQSRAAANSRILLLYAPGLEYIAGFFGCLYAGMVAVPAYPPDPTRLERSLPRLLALASGAQASLVLTTPPIFAIAQFIAGQYPEFGRLDWLAVDELPPGSENAWQPPDIHPDTLAFLQYTSGSTRTPRGVMLSHHNLLHNSQTISEAFQVQASDVGMIWLPPYHDMGLIGGILQPAFAGVYCVMMSPASFLQRPFRWLQAISRYGATISGGPNFAYDLCLRKVTPEQKATLDLSRWSLAFNGAEPVRAETMQNFARAFACCGFRPQAFYPCYGLAEATLLVSGGRRGEGFKTIQLDKHALRQGHKVAIAAQPGKDTRAQVGCGFARGCELAIVEPQTRQLLPQGEIGEVWVSGGSMAQGYWGLPEETENTFHARLTNGSPQRYMRTGDLGFLLDGELYITGRIKDLIIIRGRNIYPQDIELTVESCHPAFRPGCSAAFSVEAEGEEHLVVVQEVVANAVQDMEQATRLLRQAVSQAHDVSVYDVVLIEPRSIPKTSSGKIQRHACRQAYLAGELAVVHASKLAVSQPETPSEEKSSPAVSQAVAARQSLLLKALLALGQEERKILLQNYVLEHAARLLRIPLTHLDVNQPLSSMGLDSVSAVDLVSELESGLDIPLALESIPRDGTVAELTALLLHKIDESQAPEAASLAAIAPATGTAAVIEEYPLSYGQRALWFVQQLKPDTVLHNLAAAVRILSPLDISAFLRAFELMAQRHPSLRTTFSSRHGEPFQRVHDRLLPEIKQVDASGWDESHLQQQMAQEMYRPFDLERGPLMRAVLYRLAPDQHVLFICLHHTITDMWSMAILLAELPQLYQQESGMGPARLKPMKYRYADYVADQHALLSGPEGETLWNYWRQQLSGRLPVLNLPLDYPRPAVQGDRGRAVSMHLSASLVGKMRSLAQRVDSNLFCVTLAAFELLLGRYSGQEEFLLGTLKAGRNHKTTRLIGYFINPVVLRADLSGNPPFSTFLQRVQGNVTGAFAHDAYPFPLLVEKLQPPRDLSRTPVFQVLFSWQKTTRMVGQEEMSAFAMGSASEVPGGEAIGRGIEVGGLRLAPLPLQERVVPFDLSLLAAEANEGLALTLEYNLALFEHSTIELMLQRLQLLLESLVDDPELPIASLSMMTEAERRVLLQDWAGAVDLVVPRLCVHQLIEQQVERAPGDIAIAWQGGQITYQELNQRANRLAHYLRQRSLNTGDRVGVFMDRCLDAVVALLAILKAGGVYLPIDPIYPAERITFMLQDGEDSAYGSVRLVITNEQYAQQLAAPLSQTRTQLINLDREHLTLLQQPDTNPTISPGLESLAYVIYTSGSTGRPKGVLISNAALAYHCLDIIRHYQLTSQDIVLQFASLSFDPSLEQLLPSLMVGARVVLRGKELWTPDELIEVIHNQKLTVINLPPAYWHQVVLAWAKAPETLAAPAKVGLLRLVIIGGDVLQPESLQLWQQTPMRAVRLLNAYGPTESTITATTCEVNQYLEQVGHLPGRVPIGRPLPNRRVYVLDAHRNLAPPGVPGELYIGGPSLAEGYLGAPQLTAERFVPDPFNQPGALGWARPRLYKTGDLVRFLRDGSLDFLGRIDSQVKVRGFRVELGEIEAVLRQHPGIREAVVTAPQGPDGERRLVAYYVPLQPVELDVHLLSDYLKTRLPGYMIPSSFVPLERLPLNTSGKVDREALPAPEDESSLTTTLYSTQGYAAPRSPIEESLCQIWQQVLHVERIGVHDNFFELGGHSLMATQVVARAREAFNIDLPVQSLFECPTVAGLATHIAAHLAATQPEEELQKLLEEIEQLSEDEAARILSTENTGEESLA